MVTAFVLVGAGGLAAQHVGMLQALSARSIAPDLVIGTSAGAPNAAFIAGYGTGREALRRLGSIWAGLGRRDLFPLPRHGQIRAGGHLSSTPRSPVALTRLLRSQIPYVRIEDARIPVHFLARDVRTGSGVFLSDGLAVTAVLASCAVPGLLPAVQRRGRTLCDGGPVIGKALRHAVALGARRIVVLATGTARLVTDPPGPPFRGQRSVNVIAGSIGAAALHVVPVPVTAGVTGADYGRAPTLIHAARETATAWLDGGGLDSGGLGRSRHPTEHWSAAAESDLSGTRSA